MTRVKRSTSREEQILKKKDKNRFELLTKESAEEVRHKKGYENVTMENFQQVPGGKIQMLLGQNIGGIFSPRKYQPTDAVSRFRNIG